MPLAHITLVTKTGFEDLDATDAELEAATVTEQPTKGFLQASAEFGQQRKSSPWRPVRKPPVMSKQERERIDAKNAWIEAHRDVIGWIYDKLPTRDFAGSLVRQYETNGKLSIGQVVAVRKILAEDAARAAAQVAQVIRTEPNGSDIDLSSIPEGFYAVPDGATRLKVKIDRPVPPSKWSGFIFVSDGAEYGQQKKYGRQAPGKLYTGEIKDALRAIVADPKAASVAYGKLVGRCGICNRRLEDEESVARGIGPKCAENMGW